MDKIEKNQMKEEEMNDRINFFDFKKGLDGSYRYLKFPQLNTSLIENQTLMKTPNRNNYIK